MGVTQKYEFCVSFKFCVGLHPLYHRLWQIWNDIQRYMPTHISSRISGWSESTLNSSSSGKLRYGDATCVPYEQPQFLLLGRSNIQTMEINIRSDTGDLGSFESGKLIVTLVCRRKSLFHWCINYQHSKEQHVKKAMVLAVPL